MIELPSGDEPLDFDVLVGGIVDAIRKAYSLERINPNEDIDYIGYDDGSLERLFCLSPDERLTSAQLRFQLEEKGRDALAEIIRIAVQIGIEQGRRIGCSGLDGMIFEVEE